MNASVARLATGILSRWGPAWKYLPVPPVFPVHPPHVTTLQRAVVRLDHRLGLGLEALTDLPSTPDTLADPRRTPGTAAQEPHPAQLTLSQEGLSQFYRDSLSSAPGADDEKNGLGTTDHDRMQPNTGFGEEPLAELDPVSPVDQLKQSLRQESQLLSEEHLHGDDAGHDHLHESEEDVEQDDVDEDHVFQQVDEVDAAFDFDQSDDDGGEQSEEEEGEEEEEEDLEEGSESENDDAVDDDDHQGPGAGSRLPEPISAQPLSLPSMSGEPHVAAPTAAAAVSGEATVGALQLVLTDDETVRSYMNLFWTVCHRLSRSLRERESLIVVPHQVENGSGARAVAESLHPQHISEVLNWLWTQDEKATEHLFRISFPGVAEAKTSEACRRLAENNSWFLQLWLQTAATSSIIGRGLRVPPHSLPQTLAMLNSALNKALNWEQPQKRDPAVPEVQTEGGRTTPVSPGDDPEALSLMPFFVKLRQRKAVLQTFALLERFVFHAHACSQMLQQAASPAAGRRSSSASSMEALAVALPGVPASKFLLVAEFFRKNRGPCRDFFQRVRLKLVDLAQAAESDADLLWHGEQYLKRFAAKMAEEVAKMEQRQRRSKDAAVQTVQQEPKKSLRGSALRLGGLLFFFLV